MRRDGIKLLLVSLLGMALALLGREEGPTWEGLLKPFALLGSALRTLSLNGFLGNLAAWCVVLALSALPLLVLVRAKYRGWVSLLPVGASLICAAGLFFAVNPTVLNSPLREVFPLAALQTALSLLLAWAVLRWLGALGNAPEERLAKTLRRLFRVCALLVTGGAAYGQTAALLADRAAVAQGNTDPAVSLGLTFGMLFLLSVLRFLPDVLAGVTLMRGGELARILERGIFDGEGTAVCRSTAAVCALTAKGAVAISAAANVLQLLCFEGLRDSAFRLELPLFTLALSAGLFLLCRILERGRELQADNDSII